MRIRWATRRSISFRCLADPRPVGELLSTFDASDEPFDLVEDVTGIHGLPRVIHGERDPTFEVLGKG